MRTSACAFVLIVLLTSLSIAQHRPISDQRDIQEAVLRYQIQHWDLAAAVYCVELEGKNAPASFLRRLAPHPVKPASACRKKKGFVGYSVIEKRTKKRSVIFTLGKTEWLEDGRAQLLGGYNCADLCSAWGTYHLERKDGRWVVTSFKITMQS